MLQAMDIIIKSIAIVKNSRATPIDDHWTEIISELSLKTYPTEVFNNISEFSHLEIIYYFDKVNPANIVFSGSHVVIQIILWLAFWAAKKDRPNQIGLCTVELLEHRERIIKVRNLDAIDGTHHRRQTGFQRIRARWQIRQPNG